MTHAELKKAIDKVRGVLVSPEQELVLRAAQRELERLKGKKE
jgi:hypothetical protein